MIKRPVGAVLATMAAVVGVGVSGMAPAAAVDTDLSASTSSIDFGQVTVGNTAGPVSVTLTNTGGDPFGPINIFGGAPPTAEFNASQNCQGTTLPAGGSCTVNYTFSPGSSGSFSDTSSFTVSETASQSDGEDFSVDLAGVGAVPITVTPLAHDFGDVVVGDTAPALSTTVTNTGDDPFGPINIFGGAPPTPEFNASQNCQGTTLAPGASCTINYTYSPTTTGEHTDESSFTISPTDQQGDGADFTVALAGCGVEQGEDCAGATTTTTSSTSTTSTTVPPTTTSTTTPGSNGSPTVDAAQVDDDTPTTPPAPQNGALPRTGSETNTPVKVGAALLVLGAIAVLVASRRRHFRF